MNTNNVIKTSPF